LADYPCNTGEGDEIHDERRKDNNGCGIDQPVVDIGGIRNPTNFREKRCVSVGQTGRAEKIKVFTREISGSKGVLSTKDSNRNYGNQPTAGYVQKRRSQFEICVKFLVAWN